MPARVGGEKPHDRDQGDVHGEGGRPRAGGQALGKAQTLRDERPKNHGGEDRGRDAEVGGVAEPGIVPGRAEGKREHLSLDAAAADVHTLLDEGHVHMVAEPDPRIALDFLPRQAAQREPEFIHATARDIQLLVPLARQPGEGALGGHGKVKQSALPGDEQHRRSDRPAHPEREVAPFPADDRRHEGAGGHAGKGRALSAEQNERGAGEKKGQHPKPLDGENLPRPVTAEEQEDDDQRKAGHVLMPRIEGIRVEGRRARRQRGHVERRIAAQKREEKGRDIAERGDGRADEQQDHDPPALPFADLLIGHDQKGGHGHDDFGVKAGAAQLALRDAQKDRVFAKNEDRPSREHEHRDVAQAKQREPLLPEGKADNENRRADDDGGLAQLDQFALQRNGRQLGGESEGNEQPVMAAHDEGQRDGQQPAHDEADGGKFAVAHGQRHEDRHAEHRERRDEEEGPFEKACNPGKLLAHGVGWGRGE